MKRLFDILSSSFALLVLCPLFIPIAIVLRCTGEGEVFYRQNRVGKGGQVFGLYKFATMLKNSPAIGAGTITLKDDPRVLPFGKFLRKTKLNELPQLLNILFGHMSVVGPRPLTRETYEMIPPEIREKTKDLQPGLSGAGSLIFRDEERFIAEHPDDFREFYRDEIAPFKGQLEVWYLERKSFLLDMQLIFLTAWAVVFAHTTLPKKMLKDLPA
ncbi:MAG: sugar transferase, partial [Verrucomicrobiota bacterium]